MRFTIFGFFVLLLSFILQTTLVPHLKIFGAQPDLILVVVAVYAFIHGSAGGSIGGFFGGLLQDMVLIRNMGFNALCKTIVGYLAGLVERTVFAESILLPMVAIFIASLIHETIYLSFSIFLGEAISLDLSLWRIVIPSAIYNAILALLIYPLLCRISIYEEGVPRFK
ncbi:MAG TPA: rod shape-determining protein MreD [Actinobacteria bacterium]|nr:rod shape-determining protein MreD [Actinomycetota bacterium]